MPVFSVQLLVFGLSIQQTPLPRLQLVDCCVSCFQLLFQFADLAVQFCIKIVRFLILAGRFAELSFLADQSTLLGLQLGYRSLTFFQLT